MTHKTQYAFKRIEVSGYKSIQDVVIEDISPLMVLAGSNGAGKSNFVDSLNILNLLLTENIERFTRNFENTLDIKFKLQNQTIEYFIEIVNNAIHDESLTYIKGEKIFQYPDEFISDSIKKMNNEIQDIVSDNEKVKNLYNFLDELKNNPQIMAKIFYDSQKQIKNLSFTQIHKEELKQYSNIADFLSQLSNIQIFRIDPIQAKKPSIDNTNSLKSDGSNIASVLANLENDDEFREIILDWLSLIVPEMKDIKTNNRHIDGSKILEFTEESGKKFPAHLVSDGTIYALCMLVAILTRTQKAGITIIEEPERGLHPKAIGELIGFIREHASINHPIILTTHSESVVRELELDELFFVSKENGKTKIKSVKNSVVDKNKIPLDTAWLTNMLNGGLPW